MKNKKALIVTYHCVPNYGAVLQAYALQEKLQDYFSEVAILDYCPDTLTREYKIINTYSLKSILASLPGARMAYKKQKKFEKFSIENLNLTQKKYYENRQIDIQEYEYIFVGSDQIWNPKILKEVDKTYFGLFPKKEDAKVASYAASIGKRGYSEDEEGIVKEFIEQMDAVSVREQEAKTMLEKLTAKQIQVLPDPTVFVEEECWSKLITSVQDSDYILYYSLTGSQEGNQLAEEIAAYFQKELIEVSGKRKSFTKKKHKVKYDVGPQEFLSYIASADFVITDSFHGTIFSILFHKRFITIPHKTRNGRIVTLLETAGLTERMMSCFDKTVIEQNIDYTEINANLKQERQKAHKFVVDFINNSI